MRLIPASSYWPVFDPMLGRRVGYVRGEAGNVGDTLQEKAVWQMSRLFGIDLRWLGPVASGREPWDWEPADGRWDGAVPKDIEELACFGGGNMGLPGPSMRLRAKASRSGRPITILPNSWRAPEQVPGRVRYWARERESIERFAPSEAQLAPDMGLGLEFDESLRGITPSESLGVFLRSDRESQFANACPATNRGAAFSSVGKRDVDGYLRLAAKFRRIVTDALHFSVAGLMMGRDVWLVPGRYHKNRGMWESWLSALGCRWADDPRSIPGVS